MTENLKSLIQAVCDGDIRQAQAQAKTVLGGLTASRDENFKNLMLRKLASKGPTLIELPCNLRDILVAEDVTDFPMARFLLRDKDKETVDKVLDLYRASGKLAEMGIPYLPAIILYGPSGCGKTMLARYIAYKAKKPFVYIRFSNLVSSKLGDTQVNIGRVFEYARISPCVLCFDEIDAIGTARNSQKNDVAEMNRVVIAIMQEMDRMPNNVIVVGTTNRYALLDDALVRRFSTQYEVVPFDVTETRQMAAKFFAYAGIEPDCGTDAWCLQNLTAPMPASAVVKRCTDIIVKKICENTGVESNAKI